DAPDVTPGSTNTRWPGRKCVTPSPSRTISPIPSQPGTIGSGNFTPGIPRRTHRSRWFTDTAIILISTSPSAGSGTGRSTISSTDGSPWTGTWTTCMARESAALETRLALLDERGDAFARVRGREEPRLELALERETALE